MALSLRKVEDTGFEAGYEAVLELLGERSRIVAERGRGEFGYAGEILSDAGIAEEARGLAEYDRAVRPLLDSPDPRVASALRKGIEAGIRDSMREDRGKAPLRGRRRAPAPIKHAVIHFNLDHAPGEPRWVAFDKGTNALVAGGADRASVEATLKRKHYVAVRGNPPRLRRPSTKKHGTSPKPCLCGRSHR